MTRWTERRSEITKKSDETRMRDQKGRWMEMDDDTEVSWSDLPERGQKHDEDGQAGVMGERRAYQ